jgi:hypothetical protein
LARKSRILAVVGKRAADSASINSLTCGSLIGGTNEQRIAGGGIAAAALVPSMASAAIEEFQFNSADITASFSIDVVGSQAVNGGGDLWSPYWTGPPR